MSKKDYKICIKYVRLHVIHQNFIMNNDGMVTENVAQNDPFTEM